MQTVLVTGATGTIGKEVVTALAARADVRVLAGGRNAAKGEAQFHAHPNVTARELDLDRPESLARSLEGVHKIVQVSPLDPAMGAQTQHLVAAARAAGVQHIVRSSLFGANEPEPVSEGTWHNDADGHVRSSGIPFTILRPNQYLQNFTSPSNTASIKARSMIALPAGDARIAYIDTRDLGEIAARVALDETGAHHGKEYDLTGAEALTMSEVVAILGEVLGRPVTYVALTEAQFTDALTKAGLPAFLIEGIAGWFGYCRAGRAARTTTDAERILGKRPRTVREFAQDHADLLR